MLNQPCRKEGIGKGIMARVLIVEGNPEVGEWLGRALARIGHQALVATNTELGIRLLQSAAPELVITDRMLLGLDRLESMRRLYRRPGPRIIALYGNRRLWKVSETEANLGRGHTLHKPFTEKQLIAVVDEVLLADN
jgi:DNA-binding response OmpR family regulator